MKESAPYVILAVIILSLWMMSRDVHGEDFRFDMPEVESIVECE